MARPQAFRIGVFGGRRTASGPLAGLNKGPMAALLLRPKPLDLPEIAFADGDGKPKSLADFAGKVVLLNIWATWCVPCREEMPALDKLETKLGGKDFEVVAINIDKGGARQGCGLPQGDRRRARCPLHRSHRQAVLDASRRLACRPR